MTKIALKITLIINTGFIYCYGKARFDFLLSSAAEIVP
jgi:hypothetical protein